MSALVAASTSAWVPLAGSALDGMRLMGRIDGRQYAAALNYRLLRRRIERAGSGRRSWSDASGLSDMAYAALKREHGTMLKIVGAERWPLDRLILADIEPVPSEMERMKPALDRLAGFFEVLPAKVAARQATDETSAPKRPVAMSAQRRTANAITNYALAIKGTSPS